MTFGRGGGIRGRKNPNASRTRKNETHRDPCARFKTHVEGERKKETSNRKEGGKRFSRLEKLKVKRKAMPSEGGKIRRHEIERLRRCGRGEETITFLQI